LKATVVVVKPSLDLSALSAVAEQCLDKNPLRNTKGSLGSLQHTISVLTEFKGAKSEDFVANLIHIGVLIGADERDLPEVLEILSLPHLVKETTRRGVLLSIVVGSLLEWKEALRRASLVSLNTTTRDILNQITYDLNIEKRYLLK